MGLFGGWYMAALIAVSAFFLIREVFKVMRGEVEITARQKVVRTLGGALMMGVLLLIAFSKRALYHQNSAFTLIYWNTCLFLAVMALLMAVMDIGEIARQFQKGRKDIRRGTLKHEDIERILREEKEKQRPEDVGRG